MDAEYKWFRIPHDKYREADLLRREGYGEL